VPGVAGLEHRIGGLEKQDGTGNVSYDPANHARMTYLRAEKIRRMARDVPEAAPDGDPEGDLLVVAWGSTYGAVTAAVRAQRAKGRKVAHLHLRHLNPLPANLGDVLGRYRKVLVPEINLGQLRFVLRATYLVDAIGFNKVEGKPFTISELEGKIEEVLQ
jgi:2-oxoglutarate ferredoxin oxidoreductase subunit alpha